jgi:hypothetical protein
MCVVVLDRPVARRIQRARSSTNVAFLPYLAGLVSGLLWLKYGLLVADGLLIGVNATGALLNAFYLYTCYAFTQTPVGLAPGDRPNRQSAHVVCPVCPTRSTFTRDP